MLILLLAGQAAAFVDRSLPGVMAPALKAALKLNDIQLGALQGPAFAAFYVAASLGAGLLTEHRARVRIAAACVAAWSAAAVAFALARDFEVLVVGRLVIGPAQALFSPLALAMIAARAPVEARARHLSLFTISSAIGRSAAFLGGGVLLVLVATTVPAHDGWRIVSLAMTAPNIAIVIGLLAASDRDPRPSAPRPQLREALGWLGRNRRAAFVVVGGSAAAVLAVQTLAAWGASVLNRRFGLPLPTAALAFGVALLPAAAAGHLGGGWALDRLARGGRPATDLLAASLALCGGAVTAAAFAPTWIASAAALAVAALGASAAALSGLVAMQTLSPPTLRGPLGAIFLATTSLVGFGVGPLHGRAERARRGGRLDPGGRAGAMRRRSLRDRSGGLPFRPRGGVGKPLEASPRRAAIRPERVTTGLGLAGLAPREAGSTYFLWGRGRKP